MTFWVRTAVLTVACAVTAGAVEAQHEHHTAQVGYVPRDVLERAVPIRTGIGTVNERVSTSSSQAQAFYNQGVAYLHSYVWVEAARSFNQALRHDAALMMAYLGLSYAYSGLDDPAAAQAAFERAKSMTANVTPRESRRVDIREAQLAAMTNATDTAKHAALKQVIDQALAKDVDAVELWLLRGNAEEPTAAGRGQRGAAASVAFYERALKLEPNNFAAHHYLIHSHESIGNIAAALVHGEVYARLVPDVPHARHMYGHDLRRVGRIEDAIREFMKADELERAYYANEEVSVDFDWHHQHNLDLLSTSYEYLGQMKTAERLMTEAFATKSVDGSREYQKRDWIGYLLKRGRVQDALAAAQSLQSAERVGGRITGHIGAARAFMSLNRVDEARAAIAAAEQDQQQLPAAPSGVSLGRAAVEPEIALARAELLLRTDDGPGGRKIAREMVARLRAQLGPDAWSQALFRMEGLGQVARALGDWELAEFVATQMLEHDKSYAGAHYAAALVAAHKGDREGTQRGFSEAARLWSKADPDFAEATEARAKAAQKL